MKPAPFRNDLAEGPEGGQAWWVHAKDGVRLRVACWPGGSKGTVLLFPGRTEYIEKYGRAAADLQARGYSTVTIDWRNQGLADRLAPNPLVGHVGSFDDYQLDVAALLEVVANLDCPRPLYLIGHSMGGCIGLRALHEKLPVAAVVFSAPMWGILMSPLARPVAWALAWATHNTNWGLNFAPGTNGDCYVLTAPFEGNSLTSDSEMWEYMKRHAQAMPDIALGGPSLNWLYGALTETRRLRAMPAPDYPCATFLGRQEKIVDKKAIHTIMNKWRNGTLVLVDGAEHEVIMEKPEIRRQFFDESDALFSRFSG